MNRNQWIVWMVAALVWLVFMGPRLLVLQNGTAATQRQALLTLGVFSVVMAVIAAGLTRFLRSPVERRLARPAGPKSAAAEAEAQRTRGTDLLGPGAASRRAARAAADRRRRAAG